jgi:hypothetical protein
MVTTYTGIPDLFNQTASGSITASLNNIIYVKDYLGEITITIIFFLVSWYIIYNYNNKKSMF